ncbi:mitogen-activated protein kinase kinase [Sporothrix schenckii 1099-18]|uniref:STE/STE7/MKK protein kinase n=2 Tax=Sporothrix schenckii TaxID=29908 RepID=U7PWI4_SPOS1|nr:mitogen-activated protein kinase kinase [Sporothrix schenckii 1099-18]ERS99927.1 STE/STE7/MKK protein kinase [Sporothrix schenckii ATCC 58251]KJR85673.1 mitogen-activated protein kinase kinase [Sporothrix schenckii 1099-18]
MADQGSSAPAAEGRPRLSLATPNNDNSSASPPVQVLPVSSSPAPLRPALGPRPNAGARPPRLGLAIPSSNSVKPVGAPLPQLQPVGRPQLPVLHLATPMGSQGIPHEQAPGRGQSLQSASGGSESSAAHSRSGSFGPLDGRASNPTSAGSQYSVLSFASQYGIGSSRPHGTPDPVSAVGSIYSEISEGGVGMEREGSMTGLEAFDQQALEKARTLDVEDLDDEGWRIASMEKRIIELGSLGEGAGGAVTRAQLKGGKSIFALKVITTNPDPDVKKQIVRELGFNKECASEHICRYYGAFVDPATATISIAMEFCEGGSLDSIYREVKRLGGRTGEKVLGKIAEGVLHGLTYLHSKKIIHRDIKPSNILLCRTGEVKLCDFGVSGDFGTKGEANTFIGTSYYMAPERITGQTYTITSDVWSTGVTLLEVAQHRFPFPADGTEMQPRAGLIDLLTYIVRQPIPKLKDEPDANIVWSENFKYFIECCLEKDPNRRATPWRMLDHPWVKEMSGKRVNMSRFLSKVWGWDEEPNQAADGGTLAGGTLASAINSLNLN